MANARDSTMARSSSDVILFTFSVFSLSIVLQEATTEGLKEFIVFLLRSECVFKAGSFFYMNMQLQRAEEERDEEAAFDGDETSPWLVNQQQAMPPSLGGARVLLFRILSFILVAISEFESMEKLTSSARFLLSFSCFLAFSFVWFDASLTSELNSTRREEFWMERREEVALDSISESVRKRMKEIMKIRVARRLLLSLKVKSSEEEKQRLASISHSFISEEATIDETLLNLFIFGRDKLQKTTQNFTRKIVMDPIGRRIIKRAQSLFERLAVNQVNDVVPPIPLLFDSATSPYHLIASILSVSFLFEFVFQVSRGNKKNNFFSSSLKIGARNLTIFYLLLRFILVKFFDKKNDGSKKMLRSTSSAYELIGDEREDERDAERARSRERRSYSVV